MGCGTSQNKAKNITSNPISNEKKEFLPVKKENEGITNLNNPKEAIKKIIDVNVIFKFNDGKIETKNFEPDTSMDTIIKHAEKFYISGYTQSQLIITHELTNLRTIFHLKIKDLIVEDKNEITFKINYAGLHITQDIVREFSKTKFVAKPLFDTGEIANYDIQNEKVHIISDNIDYLLKNFNYTSSYCNGADSLFLSGGEYENNGDTILSSAFIEYNLSNLSSNKLDNEFGLIYPRKSHSMIYIPNDFIFIVGGYDCLKVEFYDRKKNSLNYHSDLNEEKIEPALSLINNSYLYAFSGSNNQASFERINLRSDKTKWEQINVKCSVDLNLNSGLNINFTQMFFAVTYFKNDSVIFLGGIDVEDKKKCYAYNYNKNDLYITDIDRNNNEFSEKFFIPIHYTTGIIIPNFYDRNFQLLVWNKESIEKAQFII